MLKSDDADFLANLSRWLDQMGLFIAAAQSNWRDARTGHYLLAKDLRKQTRKIKQQVDIRRSPATRNGGMEANNEE